MTKKIITIATLCVAFCACSFADASAAAQPASSERQTSCVCGNPDGENCDILQKKYRAKRAMLPRHLHVTLKRPQKCNCQCHK